MTLPALPPRPQPPQDYDCCGGGCADCELRLYGRALSEWKKLAAAHEAAVSGHSGSAAPESTAPPP
ncbi:oxidoreductase [Stagnimonas aquatica]|uniref:Oxidoreductase n=1 Tax=Stagnimonas aquatica TaxID=2689987 RepID=A0A3N0UZW4_9GAMM|nr:oxidoreductase [Stagnimonas aquatica]